MASVGLLYVGAVLAINGLMLLGYIDARSAAPLNLFVGALQVITPTFLIVTASGTPAQQATTILGASGLYLFGFTYLYVGINLLANLDGTGLGWFSAFVALCAIVYAAVNFWGYGGATKDTTLYDGPAGPLVGDVHSVEAVDVPEIIQVARLRPVVVGADGRINRRLQIPVRLAPRMRHEHPAARLVNRQHRAILIDDGDRVAARQINEIGFRHGLSLINYPAGRKAS